MQYPLFRKILLLITLLLLLAVPACGTIKESSIPFTGKGGPAATASFTPQASTLTSTSRKPSPTSTATQTPSPQNSGKIRPTWAASPTVGPTQKGTALPSPTASPAAHSSKEGYRLVLDENFNGSALNQDLWNTRYRNGTTNPPELEEYVPDAVNVQSGILSLTANRNRGGEMPYTSGMIASFDRFYFQYGYVEIRAKVPDGQGLWPALWLLAQDPKSANEIDILEVIGKDTSEVHTTLHYGRHDGNQGREGSVVSGSDFSQDFHIYAVDWEWNKIVWYIDGKEVYRVTKQVPREPMFLIANLAVGGVWPGPPDQTTPFPARFDIDYIRVYAPIDSK